MMRKTLFHLHTSFTDGKLSVTEYFNFAKKNGIDKLIFLEHIRREPTYDVKAFIESVTLASRKFGVEGIVGFEAKILPSGELDIAEEHINSAKFIGIAEHGFTGSVDLLVTAFELVLQRYPTQYPDKQFVWVHPGLWFKRRGRLKDAGYHYMVEKAKHYFIWIEQNLRYGLPENLTMLRNYKPVLIGIDAHSLGDLERSLSIL